MRKDYLIAFLLFMAYSLALYFGWLIYVKYRSPEFWFILIVFPIIIYFLITATKKKRD
ncbi:MAG: hypothetical protein HY776_01680 [Actinobacteria bacterium]|nr:hypothetical protein [Actinomycetota bacterium]